MNFSGSANDASAAATFVALQPQRKPRPKRPLTAYNFFFQEEHNKIRQELLEEQEQEETAAEASDDYEKAEAEARAAPTCKREKISPREQLGFEKLGTIIGKRWKALSEDEIAKYKKLAEKDSDRYKKESAEYYQNQISTACMGHNNYIEPSSSSSTTPRYDANSTMSLEQEANLAMDRAGRRVIPMRKRGRKSKKARKLEDEASKIVARSCEGTGTTFASSTTMPTSTYIFAPFVMNPAFAQQFVPSAPLEAPPKSVSSTNDSQQQQEHMMPIMMMNPAMQMQFMQHFMYANPENSSTAMTDPMATNANGTAMTNNDTNDAPEMVAGVGVDLVGRSNDSSADSVCGAINVTFVDSGENSEDDDIINTGM